MGKQQDKLKGIPTKVEDGVTLYNVARPGGMPCWCSEKSAVAFLESGGRDSAVAQIDRPGDSA